MPLALYAEERSTATVPFLITLTVRAAETGCVRPPEAPVIVIVEVASCDESSAVSVSSAVLAVVAELNVAVTPGGSPDTLRLTLDLELPRRVTVIVVVLLLPLGTEMLSAEVRSAKSSAPAGGVARRS